MTVFTRRVTLVALVALAVGSATPAEVRAGQHVKGQPAGDTQAACLEMMQGRGMSEEGRRAMQQLMRSGKAPELMDRMMQMARQMGNGDVMVGMTRMMEMMGRMGGMMGPGGTMSGQSGMMQPSPPEPKK